MSPYLLDHAPSLKQSVRAMQKSAQRLKRTAMQMLIWMTGLTCLLAWVNCVPATSTSHRYFNTAIQLCYFAIVMVERRLYRRMARDEEIARRMALATSFEEFGVWFERLTQKRP
jgi:hypothetical protein